jgi:hypothetical protein
VEAKGKREGWVSIGFSKTIMTKYGIIAGASQAKDRLVFKCSDEGGKNRRRGK